MAMTRTLQLEQLDDASREYLMLAASRTGRGLPGVYVAVADSLPTIGCLGGIAVLVATLIGSWALMTEEPIAVAMLQTAGLLLGGWLVLYSLRVWIGWSNGKSIASFILADAQTFWECHGSSVSFTDMENVAAAKGVHHSDGQGKYTHTMVTLLCGGRSRSLKLTDKTHAEELVLFVNVLAWMRSNTFPDVGDLDRLTPAAKGMLAREVCRTGEMPSDLSVVTRDVDVADVPSPQQVRSASSGVFAYLLIVAFAVGGVLLLKGLNVPLRDAAIWADINRFNDPDQRAPWLRAYLADDRNVEHRDEAKTMLRQIYTNAVARIRGGVVQNQADFVNPGGIAPRDKKVDKSLVDSLEVVLMSIAEQPTPLVSIRVKEQSGPAAGAADREKRVRDVYTRVIEEGVGKNLIAFVEAPPEVPAMVDVGYTLTQQPLGFGNECRTVFTITVRKGPDAEPAKKVTLTMTGAGDPLQAISDQALDLGLKTAGPKKLELEMAE